MALTRMKQTAAGRLEAAQATLEDTKRQLAELEAKRNSERMRQGIQRLERRIAEHT